MPKIIDPFGREINYLRLSVTDNCNYHCFYCRSDKCIEAEEHHEYLDFDEISRLIRLFTELGVSKVRLTGGEPLVRRNLVTLAEELNQLPGLTDLSMSTNGHLLKRFAIPLKSAGVSRVNISLDSIDPDNFIRITRNGDLHKVTQGIEAAIAAGMAPIKRPSAQPKITSARFSGSSAMPKPSINRSSISTVSYRKISYNG